MSVITIELDGGLIQDVGIVYSGYENPADKRFPIGVVIVDYDTDGLDDLVEVPQESGGHRDAYVHEEFVCVKNDRLARWIRKSGYTG